MVLYMEHDMTVCMDGYSSIEAMFVRIVKVHHP